MVVLLREAQPLGLLALQDLLREEARSALAALQALGIRSVMLTGDNPRAAAAIAAELGISYRAGLLPRRWGLPWAAALMWRWKRPMRL